ncbi:MAG TPA: putative sporulation protein YtxC [Bacillales bacterium]|nr:putative sporulation protein YtxC [Bacillales bacterium]
MEMGDRFSAQGLYNLLTRCANIRNKCFRLAETRIYIDSNQVSELAVVLTDYVIATKEVDWLRELIENTFYYQDPDEQQQILEIAQSIIQGEKPDLPRLKDLSSRRDILVQTFAEFLEQSPAFHYDSFLLFRLKRYRDCLEQYIEVAIDEYKLEQEYQNFVETFRRLLRGRPFHCREVHLVYENDFALYDECYRRINERALRESFHNILRQGAGVEIEPSVLITLIALSPETIYLYTEQLQAGMVKTIENVFQERLVVRPELSLPFHS